MKPRASSLLFFLRRVAPGAAALLIVGVAHSITPQALTAQIAQQLAQRNADSGVTQQVILKTAPDRLPSCDQPQLTLPATIRWQGTLSVRARCDQKQQFVQVQVTAHGKWWVAARTLKPGTRISAEDLRQVEGSLNHQPTGLIFSRNSVLGAITTRLIPRDQPITTRAIRKPWTIKSQQSVDVIVVGQGFRVRSQGKALHNATSGENVRIRLANGQLIDGVVGADGQIRVTL